MTISTLMKLYKLKCFSFGKSSLHLWISQSLNHCIPKQVIAYCTRCMENDCNSNGKYHSAYNFIFSLSLEYLYLSEFQLQKQVQFNFNAHSKNTATNFGMLLFGNYLLASTIWKTHGWLWAPTSFCPQHDKVP